MQPTQTNPQYQNQPSAYPNEQPQQYAPPAPPMQPVAPAPAQAAYVEASTVSSVDRVGMVVYILFGFLEGFIAIRILLKLLGANPDAGFSAFVYNLTAPFVNLFSGVFPTPVTHNSVFEFTSLLALVVYALVGWGIVRLIGVFGQRQTTLPR